jgi:hypothetical protein
VGEKGEMLEFTFAGGRIVDNVPENRIQIFFDSKPEIELYCYFIKRIFIFFLRKG